MEWSAATLWWVLAGALVAAELATGTFYLLMLAIGAVAGALAGHLGLALKAQIVAAALLGGGATLVWHQRQKRRPSAPASSNPDVNLDVGGRLHISHWRADGSARAAYRGSQWDVKYTGTDTPLAGEHIIRAVEANRLLVERA